MTKVYVLNHDGSTEPMKGIHCVNEDLELQRILEINPDLIPGDLINPSDPRRWIIIKREMPVPDPSTGDNRWSIDLFFADQDAIPTFIECKRYKDTRAKREVVGQMLEYAANGHHYWSKEDMRSYAEQAAKNNGISLDDEIRRLKQDESATIDDFFQNIQDNLREGQIRLVFFMEESHQELKSVVDFLNKQMERAEVLLVEARQYDHEGMKIVVPTLFGYTEEARQVKRTVTVTTGQRRKWDRKSFFNDAREKLTENEVDSVNQLLAKSQELNCELSWGTGKECGSFTPKWHNLGGHSIFSVYSDGKLTINYGNFSATPEYQEFVSYLKESLETNVGLLAPEGYEKRYLNYKIRDWSEKVQNLISVLEEIQKNFPASEVTE